MAEFRDFIDIATPPETVFDYLTTNEGMTAWMGQYADLDPTPGGQFAVDIAGHPVRGEYLVVEPYRRVVFTWGFTGSDHLPAGASTVEFLLTPINGGTRVELRHFNLPETEVAGHKHGWTIAANDIAPPTHSSQSGSGGPQHRPYASFVCG